MDLPNPRFKKRRVWRKVSLNDRLKLECAVNFGLPVDFAGKVIGLESTNTDRIIKDLKSQRTIELASLKQQSIEKQQRYHESMKEASNEAELQALMAVISAKDEGSIKRRNILKMDKKVNEFLCKYLKGNHGSAYKTTLPEKIFRSQRRNLPKPFAEPP